MQPHTPPTDQDQHQDEQGGRKGGGVGVGGGVEGGREARWGPTRITRQMGPLSHHTHPPTPTPQVIDAFLQRKGLVKGSIKFTFDGRIVDPESTPASVSVCAGMSRRRNCVCVLSHGRPSVLVRGGWWGITKIASRAPSPPYVRVWWEVGSLHAPLPPGPAPPLQLEMEDMDGIDAFIAQEGGGGV